MGGAPRIEPRERLELACRWLRDVARVNDDRSVSEADRRRHPLRSWHGTIRGEYRVATRQWSFFCPLWHTGQAVKAWVMAADVLGDEWLDAARESAAFILANQETDGPDAGLLLAYEDFPDRINISAQLETLDGLFLLSARTGEARWRDAALACADWLARRAVIPGAGLLRDLYDPAAREFMDERHFGAGRPLLDDGIFLTAWELTGEARYREIAVAIAERLLADENPPGNWVRYQPCRRYERSIHPRHAYWWGRPMRRVWDVTGDARFLFAFQRAVNWYRHALRTDGGLMRDTRDDFRTASFGHATSGAACALLMFLDARGHCGDRELQPDIDRTLGFCLNMQFTAPADPNLHGAILEKVLPPDGTDRSPYHIRDLGTIFTAQALAALLTEP